MGNRTFLSSQTRNIICGTRIGKNTLNADNLQKDLKNNTKKQNNPHSLTMTKCGRLKYA